MIADLSRTDLHERRLSAWEQKFLDMSRTPIKTKAKKKPKLDLKRTVIPNKAIKKLTLPPQLFLGKQPKSSLLKPVKNRNPRGVKPGSGGLWTSTYKSGQRGSEWKDYTVDELGRDVPNAGWILQPLKARVFVVNTLADLEYLFAKFSRPSPLEPELAKAMGEENLLDFEKMAKSFDALHLTRNGQFNTRMTTPNLYGWDIESTLWFHWKFAKNPSRVSFM